MASSLSWLQDLMDASFERASDQLTSIMSPSRRLTAEQVAAGTPCPVVLNIATVTARGEPRISAVDGHFLDGRWYFTTSADSIKARQLLARPAISASYTPKDGLGVFCHGHAVALEGDERQMLREHFINAYKDDPDTWGTIAYFRIDPTWFVGFDFSQ